MSEHDINLVTSKATGVVSEHFKLSYATPASSLTPNTLTAIAGMGENKALKKAPTVEAALAGMLSKAAELDSSTDPDDLLLAQELRDCAAALEAFGNKVLPPTNHAAFGQLVLQSQSHINDSLDIKVATNFIKSKNFGDFGGGIKDMASLTTQGLDNSLGSLPSAANIMGTAGKLFDTTDMAKFGTSTGLIEKLNSSRLGNASGVNAALTKAGVDLNRLNDPVYANTVDTVMSNIKDPKVINTVAKQFKVTPFAGLPSYTGTDSTVNNRTSLGGA